MTAPSPVEFATTCGAVATTVRPPVRVVKNALTVLQTADAATYR